MFLLASLFMNAGLLMALAGRGAGGLQEQGVDEFPELTETWTYGTGETKVAHIAFVGIITREFEERLFSIQYDRVEDALRQIRAAQNDEGVRAILLEVDSPGGEITASDEIYHALMQFKASQDDRKVLVFVRDLAASGGYYISAAGDWIMAQPTSILGSIGVIIQTYNFKGLSEKIGVTDTTIKSVANKDLLNPFHDVSPEQLGIFQATVDAFHERFFQIILESRKMDPDQLRPMADGRIFSAETALKARFIDEIGYWDEARARAASLLEEDSVKIIRYEQPQSFFDLFAQVRLPKNPLMTLQRQTPRFQYLWKP